MLRDFGCQGTDSQAAVMINLWAESRASGTGHVFVPSLRLP